MNDNMYKENGEPENPWDEKFDHLSWQERCQMMVANDYARFESDRQRAASVEGKMPRPTPVQKQLAVLIGAFISIIIFCVFYLLIAL